MLGLLAHFTSQLKPHTRGTHYSSLVLASSLPQTISFRTQSFRLTSWAKVKQMEAIRDCLQVGGLCQLRRQRVYIV